MGADTAPVIVTAEELLHFCRETLIKAGLDAPGADTVARSLVEADLRGIYTHGAVRLWLYERRARAGLIRPNPPIRVERTGPATATANAQGGAGGGGVVVAEDTQLLQAAHGDLTDVGQQVVRDA